MATVTTVPMNVDTWWTKGKLAIVFISMGQGDCCVITCPDGRHVMVDCGSKAYEEEGLEEVPGILNSPEVLKAKESHIDEIEALILTHSDRDHYNGIHTLLKGLTVKKVYFSEPAFTDPTRKSRYLDSPLLSYSENGASDAIYDLLHVEELCCVTTRASDNHLILNKWTPPFKTKQHTEETKTFGEPSKVVLPIVEDKGNDFEISILAGNVAKGAGDKTADEINPASLVTFVRMGAIKILICGDSTKSTETYLVKNHEDKLKGLTLLQVPHHGSDTSSSDDFVKGTTPKEIVVSVQKDEATHNLPKYSVINPYFKSLEETADERVISYWKKVTKTDIEKIKRLWDNEGIKYQEIKNQGTLKRCFLEKPDGNGVKILDGFHQTSASTAIYILYETKTKKKMRQTGPQGHCWFLYP